MGNTKSEPELKLTPTLNPALAAFHGDIEELRRTVGTKNRIHIFNLRDDRYPIHFAAIAGHCEIIEELVRMWHRLPRSPFGNSPGQRGQGLFYLEPGPQSNIEDYLLLKDMGTGATPMHYAASHDHANAIATLIRAVGNRENKWYRKFINRKDFFGLTPLHYALVKPKALYNLPGEVFPSSDPYSPAEILMTFGGTISNTLSTDQLVLAFQRRNEIRHMLSPKRQGEIRIWVLFGSSLTAKLLKFC